MLLIKYFAEAIRPKEQKHPVEWAANGKITIPNSKVSRHVDPDSSPWFREPLEFAASGRAWEQYIIAPTGSGKTTLFDLLIPYRIANDPGSSMIIQETEPDVQDYRDQRLLPILESCDEIAPLLASLPKAKKKRDVIAFPHMELQFAGANLSSAQRVSRRFVYGDEVWRWGHGLLAEFRGRMHERWNRNALWVSQGGDQTVKIKKDEIETELYAGWKSSDQRIWHFQCLECGEVQPFKQSYCRWETHINDQGELDINALVQSTHYLCRKCEFKYEDKPTVRRALANTGRYIPTNPNHEPRIHGWTYNCFTVYATPWSQFALQWSRAQRARLDGDKEPMRIVVQKRLAEFWMDLPESTAAQLLASGYSKADFEDGKPIDNETYRIMTIDRQRDHRWVIIRAWRADGSSMLIFEGKVPTTEEARAIQLRYKVLDPLTAQDAQYETGDVYNECAKYGWIALHGDGKRTSFNHRPKKGSPSKASYSPIGHARSPLNGYAKYMHWSNLSVKDELHQYRLGKRRPAFEFPADVSPDWQKHMLCETKIDGIWRPSRHKQNHLWDCEAMCLTLAMSLGLVADAAAVVGESEMTS